MPDGVDLTGLVADPQFQGLSPADKRTTLFKATGDDTFNRMNDGDTAQFVSKFQKPPAAPSPFTAGDFQTMQGSPIYNPNRLGSQPLPYASMGAAVSGAMARGQLPDASQQVQQSASNAAGMMPAAGATIGSVGGLPGMALGAGVGNIAGSRLRGEPSSFTDAAGDAALTYLTGKLIDVAPSAVKGILESRPISQLAGFPKAAGAMSEAAADANDAMVNARRTRRIGAAQNRAAYDDARAAFEAKQARIPQAATPTENQWMDLNKSIQTRSSDIWVKSGATSLGDSIVNPGRGLAVENMQAAQFEKLTPPEQNAQILPLWNRAGQAVDQAAAAATTQGRTVAIPYIDEAINAQVQDPAMRLAIHDRVLQMGKEVGIQGPEGWLNASPTQVLNLRRALWKMGGDAAENGARYVSQALRNEVPELAPLDQHYADLNGAKTVVERHIGEMSAGKYKFAMDPQFQHPGYAPLKNVPQPDVFTRGAYQQLYNDQLRKLGYKTAGGIGGAGITAEFARRLATGHW